MVSKHSNKDYTEAAKRNPMGGRMMVLKNFPSLPSAVFSSGTLWPCQPAQHTCCYLRLSLPAFLWAECPNGWRWIQGSMLEAVSITARELWRWSIHETSFYSLSTALFNRPLPHCIYTYRWRHKHCRHYLYSRQWAVSRSILTSSYITKEYGSNLQYERCLVKKQIKKLYFSGSWKWSV